MQSSETHRRPGVIEKAIKAHNPTQAVLREAMALDEELTRERPCFQTLLPKVSTFVDNFSSLLLHEQEALESISSICINGCSTASDLSERMRCVTVTAELMLRLCQEAQREGVDRVHARIPALMMHLIGRMDESIRNTGRNDFLQAPFEPLAQLGQQVLLIAEQTNLPEAWFEILCSLDRLLISLLHGTLSRAASSKAGPDEVHEAIADSDLSWLTGLQERLTDSEASCAEVFMDLVHYENSN